MTLSWQFSWIASVLYTVFCICQSARGYIHSPVEFGAWLDSFGSRNVAGLALLDELVRVRHPDYCYALELDYAIP